MGRGPLSDSPQVTSCRKKNKAFSSQNFNGSGFVSSRNFIASRNCFVDDLFDETHFLVRNLSHLRHGSHRLPHGQQSLDFGKVLLEMPWISQMMK